MTRIFTFYISIGLLLVGCSQDKTDAPNEESPPVVSTESSADSAIKTETTPISEEVLLTDSPEYMAKNEGELSVEDSETAYEMCVRALTDYYKAVWNGSDIELDTFIDNDHLKQYKQKEIQSQYDLYVNFSRNSVQDIDIGVWEVEYTDDGDGGFLYLHLPVEINQSVGSYGEGTEFLVRNVNGKLFIVDWYNGAKDSYDFMVRGENLTIDNPNIWNDREWVMKLSNEQIEFSGSNR